MASDPSSVEPEHRRKRLRKGTRSCWECKRRKIRCQLSSEDVPVCAGCVSRGTQCLSQEYPKGVEVSTGGNQISGRLSRVEQLLETLVSKVSSFEEEEKIMTPESIGTDDILPPDSTTSSYNHNIQETAPLLALFDNTALGRREFDSSQAPTPTSQSITPKSCPLGGSRISKIERIRQTLLDLFPSQSDIDTIYNQSSFWLCVHSSMVKSRYSVAASKFDLREISKGSPTTIARTLMHLASCIQQLDPTFDSTQLKLYPSAESRMERYIGAVQALVTSDEELVTSMEGLECLILLCSFHSNAGNPRRAWLNLRKAMNIAQLMGLHLTTCAIHGGREMWTTIVQADRYLALLLGLPAGSRDNICGPEETFQNPIIDKDKLFTKKLINLSGRIIERNQSEQTQTYATTQDIDESLEQLAAEMPKEWWDIPEEMLHGHSTMTVTLFDRLISQICYFQFVSLVHLPFLLRATTERRYEYSKFSCLKASREVINRYVRLRKADIGIFCCRIIDFGAFTATVTLFLDLLEQPPCGDDRHQLHPRDNDRHLVEMVYLTMQTIGRPGKDVVATQSANAIKSLLDIDCQSAQNMTSLKLTIPYFGTISIRRPAIPSTSSESQSPPSTRPTAPVSHDISYQPGPSIHFPNDAPINAPLVSFTSSQFASLAPEHVPVEGWEMPDADTMFFDSLLNQDLTMMNLPTHLGNESQDW